MADTPFSPEVFHVLCMYDFDAEDPDQLSFRKNDVLDVVKREETVGVCDPLVLNLKTDFADCAGMVGCRPARG